MCEREICVSLWIFPQVSIQRQHSGAEGGDGQASFKRQLSKRQLGKLQEEWDKDIPQVSIYRVMKLNAKEWWIILIGESSTDPPLVWVS